METLNPEDFLKRLSDHREAFWEKMTAERKSYGAEKPLSPEIILRRLQFGVVMERKAAEVSAPWVSHLPELELQHCLSEYVANELKHASILRKRIAELNGDPDVLVEESAGGTQATLGFSCRPRFFLRVVRQRTVWPRGILSQNFKVIHRTGRAHRSEDRVDLPRYVVSR